MTGKTLNELRSWLAGDTVEGLPHRDLPGQPQESKPKKRAKVTKQQRGKFDLDLERQDATLKFGRYSGRTISEMAASNDREQIQYLEWMLTQDFPDILKNLIKQALPVKRQRRR